MQTITFLLEDVKRPNYLKIYRSASRFPGEKFMLRSFRSMKSIEMTFLQDRTEEYWMENEGWDGEEIHAIYHGTSPNGKDVIVDIWRTPYE